MEFNLLPASRETCPNRTASGLPTTQDWVFQQSMERTRSIRRMARKIPGIGALMARAAATGKFAKKRSVATKKKRAMPTRRKMNAQKAKKPSTPQPPEAGNKLSFNHAMMYVKDVQRALEFVS